MERTWVKDVEIGKRLGGAVFLVARKQNASGKGGKSFLKLVLQDRTGSLDARIWNDAEGLSPTFEVNDLVEVEGHVEAFQGHPQLAVEKIGKPSAETVGTLDPRDFLLVAPEKEARVGPGPAGAHGEAALAQLRSDLSRVSDGHVRALLLSFVDDPEVAPRLKRAPAAKEIHHAYPGGLIEHISSCVKLAGRLADHYPMADRDLLVAGAFLHDIGKIAELSYDKGGVSYTDEGKLVGHLVMTAQWIHERASAIPGFPRELELHLTHLVLSHHGKLEYGSPKVPMTLEAFLVHELDEIDSRVASMLAQMAKGSPGDRWTDPQKPHERLLFKGVIPTEGGKRRGPSWKSFRRGVGEKKRRREVPPAGADARPVAEEASGEERPPREPRPPREERAPREERGPREERRARPDRERPPRPARGEQKLSFRPFAALVEATQEAAAAQESDGSAPEGPEETPGSEPTADGGDS